MLKVKDVKEIIESEGLETREDAIEHFKDSEDSKISRKGRMLIMKIESENELHITDLLFTSGMYPFGKPIDRGDKYSTSFLPDNDRETIQIDSIKLTAENNNRPDVVSIKEGKWVHKFNIFPPRKDELLPSIQIPGRKVNNSREVNADALMEMWNQKGAGAVRNYLENKGKKFKNGEEQGTISIFYDVELDIEGRDSYCSLTEEIGAVAGMVWMIKKLGIKEYLIRMINHQAKKNSGDNTWTCSSCRYCGRREITVKNEKDLTERDKVYACSLSDVTIGSEWNDCWDGMFEDVAVRAGSKRKIVSCPYNDKNYKSKSLGEWITEKPKPFYPITRFGDSLFVLLDGVAVDVSLLVEDIRDFFGSSDNNTNRRNEPVTEHADKIAQGDQESQEMLNRLEKLPKMSEEMALKILDGIKSGEIESYKDCQQVKGVGEKLAKMIKVYREFDINQAVNTLSA